MAGPHRYRRLIVILIRPSKYDDDGYVIRHLRGTLPSNTLSCLNSLTDEAVRGGAFGDLAVRVVTLDETVTDVDPHALVRKHAGRGVKVVVGLVGVQTNQFPRAQDLARAFRAAGCDDVLIGGFHVSGAMALASAPPPECQAMLDAGVTLVLGEVEDRWGGLLQDVIHDRRRPLYDFLASPPDLAGHPLPRASAVTQKRFVLTHSGMIDAGRGCPFNCSFCTIINVQGRRMRSRDPAEILTQIRANYRLKGRSRIRHYFFTDDNFTRNPHWEAIFDGLIRLHEVEGIHIDFMMQVDTQAARVPHFVDKAARAGCVQVFIGLESIRDDNLAAVGKRQNKSADYREMIARWHAVGVVCHVGYIIGFPNDTYDRIMEDVRALRETLLVDQASFFMLTPLPGSRDHVMAVKAGLPLDPDYNHFDSFHPTVPHARMSAEEWRAAFRDAWREFYSFEHMRQSLLRQNPHTYWPTVKNLIWYRAAMAEGAHPMVTGFVRLKNRRSRRPGLPIEGRWTFFWKRTRDHAHQVREYVKITLEMQDLWLQTRIRRKEYARVSEWRGAGRSRRDLKIDWARMHAALDQRLVEARQIVGAHGVRVSAGMTRRLAALRAAFERSAPLSDATVELRDSWRWRRPGRERVKDFWEHTWHSARRLQLRQLNPGAIMWNAVRDTGDALRFLHAMLNERY